MRAQIGVIEGGANSLLSCTATAAGTPEQRPEGYTELIGDIVIACTGGLNVFSQATSPQIDAALLTIPGFLTLTAYDPAIVTSGSCDINSDGSVTVADVEYLIGELLGSNSPTGDLNFDGVVNSADVQIVVNAILNNICIA